MTLPADPGMEVTRVIRDESGRITEIVKPSDAVLREELRVAREELRELRATISAVPDRLKAAAVEGYRTGYGVGWAAATDRAQAVAERQFMDWVSSELAPAINEALGAAR